MHQRNSPPLAGGAVVLDAGHLAARGVPVDVLRDGTPSPAGRSIAG
jgi:hypothetical protein